MIIGFRLNDGGSRSRMQRLRQGCRALLAGLFLVPATGWGQDYTTQLVGEGIKITRYVGDGGNVVIPDTLQGRPVRIIGERAFGALASLTGVTIPDSVTTIEKEAFTDCAYMTDVVIGDGVTSIERTAFQRCIRLATVTIGASYTGPIPLVFLVQQSFTIASGNPAYRSTPEGMVLSKDGTRYVMCPSGWAGRYDIPDGVTTIGEWAFTQVRGLTGLTIPDSVTVLGDGAFQNCSGLTTVVIPDGVTELPISLFSGCQGLSSVSLPSSVTVIGAGAFGSCRNLEEATLPGALEEIGRGAFSYCTSLSGLTIPATVTSIGLQAFSNCSSLTAFSVEAGNLSYRTVDGVLFDHDLTTLIALPGAFDGHYAIPDGVTTLEEGTMNAHPSITGLTVPGSMKVIGLFAFNRCSRLQTLILQEGVESLEARSFAECTSLKSVEMPDSLVSIGDHSFSKCSSLTDVSFGSGLTTMGSHVFDRCTSLEEIVIPASLTSIGSNTFHFCSNLSDVVLEDGLPALGSGMFSWCTALESITIPDSVTDLGSATFIACDNLTNVSLGSGIEVLTGFNSCSGLTRFEVPEGVTALGESAFQSCLNLREVILPASLTYLDKQAFAWCRNLEAIYFKGDAPVVFDLSVFNGTPAGFTVYYLEGSAGFTSPTWLGIPAETYTPSEGSIGTWLVDHGLPAEADVTADLNGDGVSLLMAYALNLDPNTNLTGSLPEPLVSGENLELSFYGIREGVTYRVVTSVDLVAWTTEGVVISEPNASGVRVASVAVDAADRFLRLEVQL